MPLYVVSYDLHKQRNYQPLWDGLRQAGGKKLLESFWVLDVTNNAVEIRDWLSDLVDADDSIAVIELKNGSDWAYRNAMTEGVEWLKQYL